MSLSLSLIFSIFSAIAVAKQPSVNNSLQRKMLSRSYSDMVQLSEKSPNIARYLKGLRKKGIRNADHWEQFKLRQRMRASEKKYPRSWSEQGLSSQRVRDPYQ